MDQSSIIAVKIPLQKCSSFLQKLANHLHTDSSLPSIIPDKNKSSRLVLLNKTIHSHDLTELPEHLRNWIKEQKDVSVEEYDPKNQPLPSGPLKRSQSILLESDPIAEVLPKGVDSNIKKETLKHIMILNLEKEQLPYKEKIAQLLLKRNEGDIKTIVNRVLDTEFLDANLQKYFECLKYEFIEGENDTLIRIEEDKCHFDFYLDKYYYDSSLQSERDRLFTYFDQNDIICILFPNMILGLRMAKLGLHVIINTQEKILLQDLLIKNMKNNNIEEKNLEILNVDTFHFFKKIFSSTNTKSSPKHIYIGLFLRDLSFLRCFIGLANVFSFHPFFDDEKNIPFVYFYYIYDPKNAKGKIKEHIIEVLNEKKDDLFEKADIDEICDLNHFNTNSKRVLMIKLKLTHKVLNHKNPQIFNILQIPKPEFIGKRSTRKEFKEETEKEIEKEVSERKSPRKKGSGITPSKVLHTEKE